MPAEEIQNKNNFDIAVFGLPNCAPQEIRFENPRDIERVAVSFRNEVPEDIRLYYLQKLWPESRYEKKFEKDNPFSYGWVPTDDWFRCMWRKAAVEMSRTNHTAVFTFKGLSAEFPECSGYDVRFRRTLGLKIKIADASQIKKISVYTVSTGVTSKVAVELNAGKKTNGKSVQLSAYNAELDDVLPQEGIEKREGNRLRLGKSDSQRFALTVRHMIPAYFYTDDEGLITFAFEGGETFTVSLSDLMNEGPVWFAEQGVFIKLAGDPTSFSDYCAKYAACRTISRKVRESPEQSYTNAFLGQPKPSHEDQGHFGVGCKHARQKFILDQNGDIILRARNVKKVSGRDTDLFKNGADARFFFGLKEWDFCSRFPDSAEVLAHNLNLKKGPILLEQKTFAAPLRASINDKALAPDDTIVAMTRFRFRNTGHAPEKAGLVIGYSAGYSVKKSVSFDKLRLEGGKITSVWKDETILRALLDTGMKAVEQENGVLLTCTLEPGQECEAILKIPFVAPGLLDDVNRLFALRFDSAYEEVKRFWLEEGKQGAQLHTPEPNLNALYKAHLAYVQIADAAMPDDPDLINTSVGVSVYGNYPNESCMIIQELDERGLHEEARRRLQTWLKYQGTVSLDGNFSDRDGLFFGAGGYEDGRTYDQHHGWVLWCLGEHYFLTHDEKWFKGIAASVVAGADWIFRQRRNTMKNLPHSRGWEYGFLPAGGLEDVGDFSYWLSGNVLTWRGADRAARALESIGHPEAGRIRREADAYRQDLIRGVETMRQYSPLVKLGDGRWVPHYSSRLYCRGRSAGWIREVLEGPVYLMLSGLYDAKSKEAEWILDDYQDNLYPKPPYGYLIPDFEANWFSRAGFSMQPNLLAGLMPYLDRDEPEIYIWMFFNAWCACYREEINAMIEHPNPTLGFSRSPCLKTSDESNSVKWLRYMFVYNSGDILYFGRALPREWLKSEIWLEGVATPFGEASVRYIPQADKITAQVNLPSVEQPGKILVRFRHPDKKPLKSVLVNGREWTKYDKAKNDVDITGLGGKVIIETRYQEKE